MSDKKKMLEYCDQILERIDGRVAIGVAPKYAKQIEESELVIREFLGHENLVSDAWFTQVAEKFLSELAAWLEVTGKSRRAKVQRIDLLTDLRKAYGDLQKATLLSNGKEGVDITGRRILRLPYEHFSRLIKACGIENKNNLYVLGCFDEKKTVLTQQERALWLSTSIVSNWKKDAPPKVAVVGAGIAGVTACAALTIAGVKVTLFDRVDELMSFQRRNTTRWIHPYLYDWPQPGSGESHAKLPILDWSAGYGKDIVYAIEGQFKKIMSEVGNWEPTLNVHIDDIIQSAGPLGHPVYSVIGRDGRVFEGFDIVIFAVGFGFESHNLLDVTCPSYWENDSLHPPGKHTLHNQGRILVSGSGDGGLVDVLRATFKDFRHSEILELLPQLQEDACIRKLNDIEEKYKSELARGDTPSVLLTQEYQRVLEPISLDPNLLELRNKAYKVYFNTSEARMFTHRSSVLNRVLVKFLMIQNIVIPKIGRLDNSMLKVQSGSGERRYAIKWKKDVPTETYDAIVARHGVGDGYFVQNFSGLSSGCEFMRERLSVIDLPTVLPPEIMEHLKSKRDEWL